MPYMGGDEKIEGTIFARENGTLVGCAAVDHMLQIWAGSVSVSWAFGDGRRVSKGDEIATISGERDAVLAMERPLINILGKL